MSLGVASFCIFIRKMCLDFCTALLLILDCVWFVCYPVRMQHVHDVAKYKSILYSIVAELHTIVTELHTIVTELHTIVTELHIIVTVWRVVNCAAHYGSCGAYYGDVMNLAIVILTMISSS